MKRFSVGFLVLSFLQPKIPFEGRVGAFCAHQSGCPHLAPYYPKLWQRREATQRFLRPTRICPSPRMFGAVPAADQPVAPDIRFLQLQSHMRPESTSTKSFIKTIPAPDPLKAPVLVVTPDLSCQSPPPRRQSPSPRRPSCSSSTRLSRRARRGQN